MRGGPLPVLPALSVSMKREHVIRVMAGSMVLISLALGHFVNPLWHWLGVFVGVNLVQSAFTGFCPAENILGFLGVGTPEGSCCGKPEMKKPEACPDSRRPV